MFGLCVAFHRDQCWVLSYSSSTSMTYVIYHKYSNTQILILFTDDTNIFGSGENLQQLLDIITSEFIKIKYWFDKNKQSLNLCKTKIMIFGNRKLNHPAQVQIDGVETERVHKIKFLGVIIDDKICWKSHIKYICTKIHRSISVMAKARHFLESKITSHSALFTGLNLLKLLYRGVGQYI